MNQKRKLLKRCMDTEEQRKYWAFIDRVVREYWANRKR